MNRYYYGVVQAKLDQGNVDAAWIRDPRSGPGLTLLNKAFEIYFNACDAIGDVSDGGTATPAYEMNKALTSSLFEAANSGWGPSSYLGTVNSLVDAFNHLEKNNGRWRDNNTGTYFGRDGQFVNPRFRSVTPVPSCAVNFLQAVDENKARLIESLGKCDEGLKDLAEGSDKWEQVGKALKGVETYGKYVKPLLWLTPKPLQETFDKVLEWDERIDNVHGDIDKIIRIGTSNHPVEDCVFKGLTAVLEYVPVIGPSYGQIAAEIPNFAVNMQAFADGYWARRGMQTWMRSKRMGQMF